MKLVRDRPRMLKEEDDPPYLFAAKTYQRDIDNGLLEGHSPPK